MNLIKALKNRLNSHECRRYISFCISTDTKGRQWHHLTAGFLGKKHNDFTIIPITAEDHDKHHRQGRLFTGAADVKLMICHNIRYLFYLTGRKDQVFVLTHVCKVTDAFMNLLADDLDKFIYSVNKLHDKLQRLSRR